MEGRVDGPLLGLVLGFMVGKKVVGREEAEIVG